MGNRRVMAAVCLVVLFFHCFVVVPRAHATTWEGVAGRIAFRALSPAAIAALGSGTALVVGAVVAGGIGYLIYKSGAITALNSWWNTNFGVGSTPPLTGFDATWTINSRTVHVWGSGTSGRYNCVINGTQYVGNGTWQGVLDAIHTFALGSWTFPGTTPPAVPTDYSTALASSQPSFPSNSVYASPGAAAAVVGGAAIVSAVTMSDGDADRFVTGSGASAVASDGTQAGNPNAPTSNDNTITSGDSTIIGLLSSMINYLSNLIGIKTSIDSVKTSTDNVVSGVSTMSTAITAQGVKLDNVAAISQSQAGKLDNIVSVGIQQKAVLDNIASMTNTQTTAINDTKTAVQHLDNTISAAPVATVSTVASRIDALKDAAATKFPFSLAASLFVDPPTVESNYAFVSLALTPTISIPINPLAGPMHDFFVWVRQIIVWLMWVGTLFAILRKGMAM